MKTLTALLLLPFVAWSHELRIDPVKPAIVERHFSGYGWSTAEARAGRGFVWIRKMEADLAFDWPATESIHLAMEAAPFFQTGKTQVVGCFINGVYVGKYIFPESAAEQVIHMTLPASAVKAGANTLTFRVGYLDRPKGNDNRKLGMLVDWLELRSAPAL